MNKIKTEINRMYNFYPDELLFKKLEIWHEMFLEYSSHTNLMSKNDLKIVLEKHVLDSLSVILFKGFKDVKKILDVGCGGGFPSLILAIFFPDKEIIGVDSTLKKINFLNLAKEELKLNNLSLMSDRIENIKAMNVDMITNRAVGKISDVWELSSKHLKSGGYFVSYKAKTAEIEASAAMNKYRNLSNLEFIKYELPLIENYTRELVIFKKNNY